MGGGDNGLEERKGGGGREPAGSLHRGVQALAVEPDLLGSEAKPIIKAELAL